jgi:hypothetical protein
MQAVVNPEKDFGVAIFPKGSFSVLSNIVFLPGSCCYQLHCF